MGSNDGRKLESQVDGERTSEKGDMTKNERVRVGLHHKGKRKRGKEGRTWQRTRRGKRTRETAVGESVTCFR